MTYTLAEIGKHINVYNKNTRRQSVSAPQYTP